MSRVIGCEIFLFRTLSRHRNDKLARGGERRESFSVTKVLLLQKFSAHISVTERRKKNSQITSIKRSMANLWLFALVRNISVESVSFMRSARGNGKGKSQRFKRFPKDYPQHECFGCVEEGERCDNFPSNTRKFRLSLSHTLASSCIMYSCQFQASHMCTDVMPDKWSLKAFMKSTFT